MEQEQLRIERDEMSSRYHDVLSSVCRLTLASTAAEDSLEELVSKLQLLYEDSQIVLVSAGPLSQVVKNSPLVRGLESKLAGKDIERVAAVAVADASKRK